MSGLSFDATAANGRGRTLDARHLDLLRRYRDAMRDLLSLSRAEYAPRPADEDDEDPNEDPNEDNEDENFEPLYHLYDVIHRITPKRQEGYRDDITAIVVNLK